MSSNVTANCQSVEGAALALVTVEMLKQVSAAATRASRSSSSRSGSCMAASDPLQGFRAVERLSNKGGPGVVIDKGGKCVMRLCKIVEVLFRIHKNAMFVQIFEDAVDSWCVKPLGLGKAQFGVPVLQSLRGSVTILLYI